jgi:hypothetical protein
MLPLGGLPRTQGSLPQVPFFPRHLLFLKRDLVSKSPAGRAEDGVIVKSNRSRSLQLLPPDVRTILKSDALDGRQ